MKRKNTPIFRMDRKKKSKAWPITFSVMALILLSTATWWVWENEWNLEKSYNRLQVAITDFFEEQPEEAAPTQNSEGEKEEDDGVDEPKEDETETPSTEETPKEPAKTVEESIQYIEGQELPAEPTYIDGVLIASKQYPLPSTFAPGENKEAREAFNEMRAAALLEEIELTAFSTYRSFEYQTDLYNRYVERDGVEKADRYSARPGYSEHQTGLAFDIGEVNQEKHWASSSFEKTQGGRWLEKNAHRYGFILRYPKGKEHITGYMYESWHFRYVGKEMAKDIYANDLTLEEYLDL